MPSPDDTDSSTVVPLRGIQPRRLPVQARSRERVERILDAAAQLLTEEGYNAVKTNLIAKRAGVSIGSVYQFFPNRFAIIHALANRYQARIAETMKDLMGPEAPIRPWDEIIPEALDILADMWRSDWAFFSVWLAIQNTTELREVDQQNREMLIEEILAPFLTRILPLEDKEQIETVARVMFETTNLMLDQSMRMTGEQDPLMIDELKFLLHSYLSAHIRSSEALHKELD
jgi:AcrR family transcriptional regulator